jgi:Tfp pilus assembly protein PilN
LADGFLTLVAAVRSEDLRQLNAELQKAGLHASRILPVALGATAVAARSHLTDALVVEAPATGGGYTFDVVSKGIVRLSRTAPEGADLTREAQRTLAAAGIEDVPLVAAGDTEQMRAATPLLPGIKTQASAALDLLQDAPAFAFELAEDRIREKRKRVNLQVRIAAATMILALIAAGTVWGDRVQKQAAVNRGKSAWTRQIDTQKTIMNTQIASAQAAVDKEMTLKNAFVTPQPIGDIAAVAGDQLPKSVWLTGISIELGKPIQIRGTATDADDVARYLKSLTDSRRFRDVRLVVANTGRINENTVVEFNLTARAIGNLPMPKPTIKKGAAAKTSPASSEPKQ